MYRILIVEDDEIIARSLKKHLESWDYDVVCVEDFSDVMKKFAGAAPQLVLMDIKLPFYNGYHWCSRIREVSKVPVIFVSSASDNMNIVMAVNMGGDDFIAKPFDLDVLTAKIQALLRRTYDFAGQNTVLEHRGALLNLGDATLICGETRVDLTKNELKILQVLMENKEKIAEICNARDPMLVKLGGGVKDVEVRVLDSLVGPMVVVHLLVDTGDAMGANAVNTMAEAVAPFLEELTGGRAELRILSNLADHRIARARAVFKKDAIGGEEVVDKMIAAYAFAAADPYRAATNNKGIMNGIIPVVIATGNDTRAIESGAHAYAARSGQYSPFATWEKNADGDLVGSIEMPMAVGLVGGATKIHPAAKVAVKMLGVKTAGELAQIIAAVGLAQNMAAMRALATEGIQRGHMSLHARNLAATAGATGELLEKIVKQMVSEKNVRLEYAQELVKQYQK